MRGKLGGLFSIRLLAGNSVPVEHLQIQTMKIKILNSHGHMSFLPFFFFAYPRLSHSLYLQVKKTIHVISGIGLMQLTKCQQLLFLVYDFFSPGLR